MLLLSANVNSTTTVKSNYGETTGRTEPQNFVDISLLGIPKKKQQVDVCVDSLKSLKTEMITR